MANANRVWCAWVAAAAVVAFTILLSACGGDNAPSVSRPAAAASPAATASPSPAASTRTPDAPSASTPTQATSPPSATTASPTTATATEDAVTPPPATPSEAIDDPETPVAGDPSPSPTDTPETPVPSDANTLTITQGAQSATVDVEYAATEVDRERGLMGRDVLPDTEGMLFVFPTLVTVSFWMKDTPNPLDIAFIADDGTVLNIAHGKPFDHDEPPPVGEVTATCSKWQVGGSRAWGWAPARR